MIMYEQSCSSIKFGRAICALHIRYIHARACTFTQIGKLPATGITAIASLSKSSRSPDSLEPSGLVRCTSPPQSGRRRKSDLETPHDVGNTPSFAVRQALSDSSGPTRCTMCTSAVSSRVYSWGFNMLSCGGIYGVEDFGLAPHISPTECRSTSIQARGERHGAEMHFVSRNGHFSF